MHVRNLKQNVLFRDAPDPQFSDPAGSRPDPDRIHKIYPISGRIRIWIRCTPSLITHQTC